MSEKSTLEEGRLVPLTNVADSVVLELADRLGAKVGETDEGRLGISQADADRIVGLVAGLEVEA